MNAPFWCIDPLQEHTQTPLGPKIKTHVLSTEGYIWIATRQMVSISSPMQVMQAVTHQCATVGPLHGACKRTLKRGCRDKIEKMSIRVTYTCHFRQGRKYLGDESHVVYIDSTIYNSKESGCLKHQVYGSHIIWLVPQIVLEGSGESKIEIDGCDTSRYT